MASAPKPVSPPRKQDFSAKVNQFWHRVTDGLELNQLWNQFRRILDVAIQRDDVPRAEVV